MDVNEPTFVIFKPPERTEHIVAPGSEPERSMCGFNVHRNDPRSDGTKRPVCQNCERAWRKLVARWAKEQA